MGVLDEKVELFSGRLITETIRQWTMLIVLTVLLGVIATSIYVLVRTYRR